jgi:hypothetical protein
MSRPYDRNELQGLMDLYCQGALSDEQSRRLASILRENSQARRDYLEYMDVHAALQWEIGSRAQITEISRHFRKELRSEVAKRSRSPVLGFLDRARQIGGESPLATALMWMVMAILLSGTLLTAVFICMMIFGIKPPVGQQAVAKNGEQGAGNMKQQAPSSSPVARLIRLVDCNWESGAAPPATGDDLAPGRKLALKSGLAEIIFQGGAKTVLEGPATLEINSRTAAFLRQGKFTVTVENPLARGFAVYTPGMKYTDLGTEFGVMVAQSGEQEVHVFRGKVQAEVVRDEGASEKQGDAESPSSPPHQASPPPAVILSANEAIHVAAPSPANGEERQVRRIASDEKRFFRAIPSPTGVPLFGTGVGLKRGAADPHWEITKISTDDKFKPQSAVVTDPLPIYLRGGKDTAQWISNSQALRVMPDACRCTYCTRFDLKGYDASTARIEGRFLADDYVVEMRVNGKSVPLPLGAHGQFLYAKWLAFKIEEGFVAGENTLEIVIENSSNAQKGYVNTMALCVECKCTAQPMLTSKTDK